MIKTSINNHEYNDENNDENNSTISYHTQDKKFKQYSYRWVITLIFIFYTLVNSAYTVSFAPIAD